MLSHEHQHGFSSYNVETAGSAKEKISQQQEGIARKQESAGRKVVIERSAVSMNGQSGRAELVLFDTAPLPGQLTGRL